MSKRVRTTVMGITIEAHPIVFPISAALIIAFVATVSRFPNRALMIFNWLQNGIANNFSWLYILSMTGFLIFALYLCFSKLGSIKLGADDAKPEFSRLTWFAMLFSAGMGIGMLFFGVSEPMFHYLFPSLTDPQSLESAKQALGTTLFHWCLHPWALYAIVALALAYFGFRRGLPLSFRSVFYPILGDRIHGILGDIIDILAVLATLFGLATSLGLGAKQVNAGLNYVFNLPQTTFIQVIIIACITVMAVASLISGLHVGIRRLSELNMVLAGLLLLFLFVAGPTTFLLDALVENAGEYLHQLPGRSFWTATYEAKSQSDWFSGWTIFYWGWWIAWSPFVGMFIARVSKGRTIREFITGVLLVPTGVAMVWMTGFGNSAIFQEIYQRVARDPQKVEQRFDYAAEEYNVQVLDDTHGLPMTPDGAHLIAPDAKKVAYPTMILLNNHGKTPLTTVEGDEVEYRLGVLVDRATGKPYKPSEDDTVYEGAFKSTKEKLTLGGYLSKPVLTDDARKKTDTIATAMFVMLKAYPLTALTALIGTLSIILFFVTSSDSASMVADIIASGGSRNPTTGTRLFWGILEGALAAVLLLAGGLVALQTGAITIGLPFCIVIILMCVSLFVGLRRDLHGKIEVDSTPYYEKKKQ